MLKLADMKPVDLSEAAERRFEAAAAASGAAVVTPDAGELHRLMCATVELLFEIDAATLPPVVRDAVPR